MKPKLNRWNLLFDRLLASGAKRQLWIIVALFAIVFLAGCAISCLITFGSDNGDKMSPGAWAFYLLVDSNALSSVYLDNYPSTTARIVASLFATVTSVLGVIIFGGLLISMFTNLLDRRVDNYRNGIKSYVKSGHYVVLGYDSLAPTFIRQICEASPDNSIGLTGSNITTGKSNCRFPTTRRHCRCNMRKRSMP